MALLSVLVATLAMALLSALKALLLVCGYLGSRCAGPVFDRLVRLFALLAPGLAEAVPWPHPNKDLTLPNALEVRCADGQYSGGAWNLAAVDLSLVDTRPVCLPANLVQ